MTAPTNDDLAARCAYLADDKHTQLLDTEREELRAAAERLRSDAARIKALEEALAIADRAMQWRTHNLAIVKFDSDAAREYILHREDAAIAARAARKAQP